jgi:hypothetical protein
MKLAKTITDLEGIRNTEIFYRKFTFNDNPNLNVNGSVTPMEFKIEDMDLDNFIITRVDYIISIDETIDLNKFGNTVELTNGINFTIDGNVIFKNNGDLLLFVSDATIDSAKIEGSLTSIINGHWSLEASFQNGLIANKENLKITINDDLSSITFFQIAVSGIKLEEN